MKKKKRKELEKKILTAIKEVITENNVILLDKTVRTINKSIKKIAKKFDIKKKNITNKEILEDAQLGKINFK